VCVFFKVCIVYTLAIYLEVLPYHSNLKMLLFTQGQSVTLRAPVSESLSQLKRDQLQKFAQYLISELPQQVRNEAYESLLSVHCFNLLTLLDKIMISSIKIAIFSLCPPLYVLFRITNGVELFLYHCSSKSTFLFYHVCRFYQLPSVSWMNCYHAKRLQWTQLGAPQVWNQLFVLEINEKC
jgi:hypothetical protein